MKRDEYFMRMALSLAERGRGHVEPNPVVGCVIVKGDRVVSQGYHRAFGGDHAEADALRKLKRGARGAEMFVSLEPCAIHAKTPPCTDAIMRAGIARVVIGARDPTQPDSARMLRRAGISVQTGVRRQEAEEQNAPFFKLRLLGLPYVTAKWAMSVDGKIATRTGHSRWISSPESRRFVHKVRARMDAVLVGLNTVLRDDPILTVRSVRGRNPIRVVADSRGRAPLNCRVVRSASRIRTIIAVSPAARTRNIAKLERAGCEVWRVRKTSSGISLRHLLKLLAAQQTTNVMVEGGGKVLGSLFEKDLVDRILVFLSPRVIGGADAISPVEGRGARTIHAARKLQPVNRWSMGNDMVLEYRVHKASDFLGHRPRK